MIDDFAHNPDKIAATLATLHDFPGRLLVMFQPHGFGPLKLMKNEFIACFAEDLSQGDVLVMPEPVYFGGTVERAASPAATSSSGVRRAAARRYAFPDRAGLRRQADRAGAARRPHRHHGRARRHAAGIRGGAAEAPELAYQQVKPPSACTVAPVIRLAASLARKCTTEAISCGWPRRFIGVSRSHSFIMASTPGTLRTIGVSI